MDFHDTVPFSKIDIQMQATTLYNVRESETRTSGLSTSSEYAQHNYN
jgi:hypothetical protein